MWSLSLQPLGWALTIWNVVSENHLMKRQNGKTKQFMKKDCGHWGTNNNSSSHSNSSSSHSCQKNMKWTVMANKYHPVSKAPKDINCVGSSLSGCDSKDTAWRVFKVEDTVQALPPFMTTHLALQVSQLKISAKYTVYMYSFFLYCLTKFGSFIYFIVEFIVFFEVFGFSPRNCGRN